MDNRGQAWQNGVIESIVNLVRTKDGDFASIGKLSQAIREPQSLQTVIEFLSNNPQGKRAFQERPRLGEVNLQALYQLPSDTLGHVYAKHMLDNQLKPLLGGIAENDLQFLETHITETHDLWHVVTGCDTNILGEVQLEAFYVAQLYATRFWMALLAKNMIKTLLFDIEGSTQYMDAIVRGWLMAKQAKPLFGIAWNQYWEKPLQEVRDSFNIVAVEV